MHEIADGTLLSGPRLEFSVSDATITGDLLDVFAKALLDRCPASRRT